MPLLLLLAALSANAQEPEPSPIGVEEPAPEPEAPLEEDRVEEPPEGWFAAPATVVVDEAKRRYFEGDPSGGLELLLVIQRRVQFGEPIDDALAAEALIYLGEIHYGRGEYEAANLAFRQVLERDPDEPINPYQHPSDVVGAFEVVRGAVKREREAMLSIPVRLPPVPVWGYLPFGVPQFAQGQLPRGMLFGGLQIGFGALSVTMQAELTSVNGPPWAPRTWTQDEYDANAARLQRTKWLVQWPSTIAFYGLWYASVADGRRTWRLSATPVPAADGRPVAPAGTMLWIAGDL